MKNIFKTMLVSTVVGSISALMGQNVQAKVSATTSESMQAPAKVFLPNPMTVDQGVSVNWHESHASHGSHGSHESHSSHYSSRY